MAFHHSFNTRLKTCPGVRNSYEDSACVRRRGREPPRQHATLRKIQAAAATSTRLCGPFLHPLARRRLLPPPSATVPQGIQQRPPASSHMPLQSLAAIMPAAVLRAFLRQQQLARRRGCQFFELSLPPGRQPPTACLDRHGLRLRPPLSPPSRAPATSHAHRQLHLLRADMDWSRQQLVT